MQNSYAHFAMRICSPFVHRSEQTIADTIEWITRKKGVQFIIHYLDNFRIVGAPGLNKCVEAVSLFLSLLNQLGVLVAWDKLEGLTPKLTFLGFELDSLVWKIRLPAEKLSASQDLVRQWVDRRSCTSCKLESLVGSLVHASRVIKPWKTFMRRLFELLAGTSHAHHHIRRNVSFRSNLLWWSTFMESWNGVALLSEGDPASQTEMWTDASRSYGCGTISTHLRQWIQLQWPPHSCAGFNLRDQSILWKELVPIVLACAV